LPIDTFIDGMVGGGAEQIRESRISKKFQEMTTKRVVSIVMICIICAPMISSDNEFYLGDTSDLAQFAFLALST